MAEVARMKHLQVLHAHYAIPFAIAAILARQIAPELDLKVVTTLHGTDITLVGNQPIFQRITRFCIAASDRVTAVSRFLEQETRRIFGIDTDIRVVHNFVDCERFRPRTAPELRRRFAADGEVILMHASNFRPVKNVGVLLEVFAAVVNKQRIRKE